MLLLHRSKLKKLLTIGGSEMFTMTIARKILGIALVLIALMTTTAVVSTVLVIKTGVELDAIIMTYVPVYGNLARANIRSLERALDLRRMIDAKLRGQGSGDRYERDLKDFVDKGQAVESETKAAQVLINDQINRGVSYNDAVTLGRIDNRIDTAMKLTRLQLNETYENLMPLLDKGDVGAIDETLLHIRKLRDELNRELDSVRSDMMALLSTNSRSIKHRYREVIVVSVVLTILAAVTGVVFALLISRRITQPVRRLLEGAREVAAGRLGDALIVQSKDEIGRLTDAFNKMVEQLREKERLRETFGKYVDPRVVEGLLNRPDMAREGQRRIMTVLFCDIKGFTQASERMTPQGLVKIMNRYFSVMTEAIRRNGGVVDKYIGDAIMAYWGAPFVNENDQARLASLAALEMRECLPSLQAEFPELLGLRDLSMSFDIRIGIATGEVLVGSIGSDIMMSYTVMGDTVNLASRLEGVNKVYGSHIMVSEATVKGAEDKAEFREIDRVVVLGQTKAQSIYEIMALSGAMTPSQRELRKRFTEGLGFYRAQQWNEARRCFQAALDVVGDDGPSLAFLDRIEKLTDNPPEDGWDGSWHLDHK